MGFRFHHKPRRRPPAAAPAEAQTAVDGPLQQRTRRAGVFAVICFDLQRPRMCARIARALRRKQNRRGLPIKWNRQNSSSEQISPPLGETGVRLLALKKLDKSFSATRTLKAVNLTFEQGEIHAIVGEKGAGKSTLIKRLTGVCPRTSGEAT